jgi:hypothetical protein
MIIYINQLYKLIALLITPRRKNMARPIEATPVLRGKDAAAFIKAIQNPKPYTPPIIDIDKLNQHVNKAMAARAKK